MKYVNRLLLAVKHETLQVILWRCVDRSDISIRTFLNIISGSISVPAICEQTAGRKGAKISNVGENFIFVTS